MLRSQHGDKKKEVYIKFQIAHIQNGIDEREGRGD
jgi:hypothetical protein